MSIAVHVGLLGGKTATVKADKDEQVEALSLRAQTALGVGGGLLVDSSGRALVACSTIKAAKIQNGDSLTWRTNRLQIQSSCSAFAGLFDDGSVSTWGAAWSGGDSSSVQSQLKNVSQIQASQGAFACASWRWLRRDMGFC